MWGGGAFGVKDGAFGWEGRNCKAVWGVGRNGGLVGGHGVMWTVGTKRRELCDCREKNVWD